MIQFNLSSPFLIGVKLQKTTFLQYCCYLIAPFNEAIKKTSVHRSNRMKRTIISSIVLAGLIGASGQATAQVSAFNVGKQNLKNTTRIIGGKEASPTAYPFMTALTRAGQEEISPLCGASYIGGRYVMTAAHCISNEVAAGIDVWIGGFDTTEPDEGKRVAVAQIYSHESYDDYTTNNDIAILELVEEIEGVTPIKMITPEIEATLDDGFEFTVMGWGNTNTESTSYPQKLQEVNVPLYNREQCIADYTQEGSSESGITDQMICAGFVEGGKDSCQGDSGGPLVFQREGEWYQAGVVSFGNGCAQANAPGVYARVSQYNQWIEEKKAGVSYRQMSRIGFVEGTFDELLSYHVKNITETAFTVTNAAISATENIESAAIAENQCLDKELAQNESCNISVQVKTNMVGNGKFTLKVDTTNPVNKQVEMYTTSTTLEQESLDFTGLVGSDNDVVKWWGGGDLRWEATTTKTSQGDSALASGEITHWQQSIILATINNDRVSEFNFDYLVSSEAGYDSLYVLHNNRPILEASGVDQTEFVSQSITLGEGKDRILFIYGKDVTDIDPIGDDKAYIDKVSTKLHNTAPTVRVKQARISVQEGQSFTLDASDTTDAEGDSFTYKWEVTSVNKVPLSNASSANMTLTAPAYKDVKSLTFKVTATDALGATSSANVTVTITEQPKKSSGGSFGYALLPLLILMFRRIR